MKSRLYGRTLRAAAVVLAFFLLSHAVWSYNDHLGSLSGIAISNREEIVGIIRGGLKNHSPRITIRFLAHVNGMDTLDEMIGELVEQAMDDTGVGTEGDYIRYQYGGYENHYRYERDQNGVMHYTVELSFMYYTDLEQEARVTEELETVMDSLALTGLSDEEKVRRIYDYVYNHVSYDLMYRKNRNYHLKLTAYNALINQRAVCQGYCVLLYRMLTEAGIRNRIVTGIAGMFGESGQHSWNIVELGGLWYNLDCTWDKVLGEHRCYLAGEENFGDHKRDAAFCTERFVREHPMSQTDKQ